MAKVKISEFNFDYAPLSDEQVVKWLIENRCAVLSHLEYGTVDDDVIITYADLDNTIKAAGMSPNERMTVDLVMRGYAIADISDEYGGHRQTYTKFFSRAVKKICAETVRVWSVFHGQQQAKGVCY